MESGLTKLSGLQTPLTDSLEVGWGTLKNLIKFTEESKLKWQVSTIGLIPATFMKLSASFYSSGTAFKKFLLPLCARALKAPVWYYGSFQYLLLWQNREIFSICESGGDVSYFFSPVYLVRDIDYFPRNLHFTFSLKIDDFFFSAAATEIELKSIMPDQPDFMAEINEVRFCSDDILFMFPD